MHALWCLHDNNVGCYTSLTFARPLSAIFTNACAILGVFHVSTTDTGYSQ